MDKLLKILETGDVHVVVLPHDMIDTEKSQGPTVMEMMVSRSTIPDAVSARTRFACCGDGVICKLVPLTHEEIRAAIKK